MGVRAQLRDAALRHLLSCDVVSDLWGELCRREIHASNRRSHYGNDALLVALMAGLSDSENAPIELLRLRAPTPRAVGAQMIGGHLEPKTI